MLELQNVKMPGLGSQHIIIGTGTLKGENIWFLHISVIMKFQETLGWERGGNMIIVLFEDPFQI